MSEHKERESSEIMEFEYQWLSSENVMKKLCWTIGLMVITSVIILLEKVWLKPRRIRSVLEKQGIKGPKPSFPFGNVSEMQQLRPQPPASADSSEEWAYSLFPYFHIWKQQFGMSKLLKFSFIFFSISFMNLKHFFLSRDLQVTSDSILLLF